MKCPAEIVLHQSHRDIRRQAAKQIASACPTANAPRCCRKPERRDISNRAANAGSLPAIRHLTVQTPPDILSARRSAKPPHNAAGVSHPPTAHAGQAVTLKALQSSRRVYPSGLQAIRKPLRQYRQRSSSSRDWRDGFHPHTQGAAHIPACDPLS